MQLLFLGIINKVWSLGIGLVLATSEEPRARSPGPTSATSSSTGISPQYLSRLPGVQLEARGPPSVGGKRPGTVGPPIQVVVDHQGRCW